MKIFAKKSLLCKNKTLIYYRPSQSRTVQLKTINNKEFFPSLKLDINGLTLEYVS
ncbi:MAG: hypothetical protein ACTSQO_04725 [Candidatus Helarchaeota archaeon]